ncbi:uncharacterized protein LOC107266126 [Cephus cinctus]|uniref:Uncharacterized protein LOC107266126 n=1 Tax=Cephus cinctus TaxID=211228 RepID=A0AAJ7BR72_CEPCN|nr:uncharacterized protein LOC107266126 [Cephus cinctus]
MYKNRALLISIGFLVGYVYCKEELWCHHCNVDLNDGRKGECNDPYIAGGVANLKACPRNEEYHCIKGIVYYKNTRTTVRGCVPSRNIRDYCSNETFPEASVECHFCKEYGCNGSSGKFEKSLCSFVTWILIALRIFQYNQ